MEKYFYYNIIYFPLGKRKEKKNTTYLNNFQRKQKQNKKKDYLQRIITLPYNNKTKNQKRNIEYLTLYLS